MGKFTKKHFQMNEVRSKIEAAEREVEAIRKVLRSFVDYKNDAERGSYLETCFEENDPYRFYIRCTEGQLQEKEGRLQEQGGEAAGKTLAQSSTSEDEEIGKLTKRPRPSEVVHFQEHEQFRMNERGEYLEVELPDLFAIRYGVIPRTIYIRPCYKDLYSIVREWMLIPSTLPAFLFTGVPGIGKSVFLIYFLFRFLKDKDFPDKRFALEFHPGDYHYFELKMEGEGGVFQFAYSNPRILSLEVPIFADIKSVSPPRYRGKWLFIFSSPNPGRYKADMKINGRRYTLPTWSYSELLCVRPDENNWTENFNRFGGVPRFLFYESKVPDQQLQNDLAEKCRYIAERFFKSGVGDMFAEDNHMLLHINPRKSSSDDGMLYEYKGAVVWSFASFEVYEIFATAHRRSLLAQANEIFHAGVSPESWVYSCAGLLFEMVCLWLVPMAGTTISVQSLSNQTNGPNSVDIALPECCLLDHQWQKRAAAGDKLQLGVLYQPRTSNLELGDAFCLLPGGISEDHRPTLVVLQITVEKTHPVKVNSLNDIFSAFPENSIKRKLLVFVTPQHGKLNSEQPIRTQKGEEGKTILRSVQELEQFLCRRAV